MENKKGNIKRDGRDNKKKEKKLWKYYLGGIPVTMTELELGDELSNNIENFKVHIMKNSEQGSSKGCGSLEVYTKEDAEYLKKNKVIVKGVELQVEDYVANDDQRKKLLQESNERSIYAGGLPLEADKNDLEEYFQKFGKIKRAYIIYNLGTEKKSKGFGFVEFESKKSTSEVLKIEEHSILGKQITVTKRESKQEIKNSKGNSTKTPSVNGGSISSKNNPGIAGIGGLGSNKGSSMKTKSNKGPIQYNYYDYQHNPTAAEMELREKFSEKSKGKPINSLNKHQYIPEEGQVYDLNGNPVYNNSYPYPSYPYNHNQTPPPGLNDPQRRIPEYFNYPYHHPRHTGKQAPYPQAPPGQFLHPAYTQQAKNPPNNIRYDPSEYHMPPPSSSHHYGPPPQYYQYYPQYPMDTVNPYYHDLQTTKSQPNKPTSKPDGFYYDALQAKNQTKGKKQTLAQFTSATPNPQKSDNQAQRFQHFSMNEIKTPNQKEKDGFFEVLDDIEHDESSHNFGEHDLINYNENQSSDHYKNHQENIMNMLEDEDEEG